MRIIEFRGKKDGRWVSLNLFSGVSDAIDIETICQFTGLYDCNEKEIYEGDILKYIHWENKEEILYYITFEDEMGSFVLQKPLVKHKNNITQMEIYGLKLEVIGNIHDNPELLNLTKK